MKRSVALAVSGALMVVVLGAVALWPRGATPTDETKVRKNFEARAADSTRPDEAIGTPAPGIYRYDTSGSEELKLGVLPTETRPYRRRLDQLRQTREAPAGRPDEPDRQHNL